VCYGGGFAFAEWEGYEIAGKVILWRRLLEVPNRVEPINILAHEAMMQFV
jgi:hypothetical protein